MTITLLVVLAILLIAFGMVFSNTIKNVGWFIYGITIWPWTEIGESRSTGNGAGMMGALLAMVIIAFQLFIIAAAGIAGLVYWIVA